MTYKVSGEYSKFDGHWIAGKFYNGTLVYKNKDSFQGFFRDGRRHNGMLTFAEGGDSLETKETRAEFF